MRRATVLSSAAFASGVLAIASCAWALFTSACGMTHTNTSTCASETCRRCCRECCLNFHPDNTSPAYLACSGPPGGCSSIPKCPTDSMDEPDDPV